MTKAVEIIRKPKEETAFVYTCRKPFTASIWRRKKVRQKVLKKTIEKKCPKCGNVTTKNIYGTRMEWSSWQVIKTKERRGRKSAIKQATKWFESYSHRLPRREKVKLT